MLRTLFYYLVAVVVVGGALLQRSAAQDVDFSDLFASEDVDVIEGIESDTEMDMEALTVLEEEPDVEQDTPEPVTDDLLDMPFDSADELDMEALTVLEEEPQVEEVTPDPVAVDPLGVDAEEDVGMDALAVPSSDINVDNSLGRDELTQIILKRDRQIQELKFALEELTADYSSRMEKMRAQYEQGSDEVREVVELRTQLELAQHELNALKSSGSEEKEVTDNVFSKISDMEVALEETEGAVTMLGHERDRLIGELEEKENTISKLLEDKSDALGDQVAEFKAELEEKALALAKAEERIRTEYDSQMKALKAGKTSAIAKLASEHATAIAEMTAMYEARLKDLQAEHKETFAAQQKVHDDQLTSMRETHTEKYDSLKAEFDTYRSVTQKKLETAENLRGEIERLTSALDAARRENEKERFMLAYNSGALFLAAGRYDRAETEFQKALDVRDNDAALHYNMGILYDEHIDRPEKARFHYSRFLALAPNDRDAPTVQQWLRELQ